MRTRSLIVLKNTRLDRSVPKGNLSTETTITGLQLKTKKEVEVCYSVGDKNSGLLKLIYKGDNRLLWESATSKTTFIFNSAGTAFVYVCLHVTHHGWDNYYE